MQKSIEKVDILDAWIMIEHLSEGDIDDTKKDIWIFDGLENNDFYRYAESAIMKSESGKIKYNGFAVYFDVFSFNEVISVLRELYDLQPTEEDIRIRDKFSFVVYFDKDMNLQKDMTFFTSSGYIRHFKKIPHENELKEYEDELKKLLEQEFDNTSNDADKFNDAMCKFLRKYNISAEKCRLQLVKDIENATSNLHSFFIGDLESAKNLDTPNMTRYLFGDDKNRVDLDSKSDSVKFDPEIFTDILQPCNYPLGRFPGNPDFALSFMQQVAVNLSIGYDHKSIRSVNGPPGTGKTTLLKDVFAEFIVEQAYDITSLSDRKIEGTDKTTYFDKKTIGVLPDNITEKSIVVASSNNGAVKNIVNELPVIEKQIDKRFINDLLNVDYFRVLSNTDVSVKWEDDENGKKQRTIIEKPNEDVDKHWGLFSLEGGRRTNVDKIVANIELICKYFEEEYVPDTNVYREFLDKYNEVKALRDEKQKLAQLLLKNNHSRLEFSEIQNCYESEYQKRLSNLSEQGEIAKLATDKRLVDEVGKLKKPGLFSSKSDKQIYTDRINKAVGVMKELLNALDMTMPYDQLQLSNPWFDKSYRIAQSELFVKALAVRKQFLYENRKNLVAATQIWSNQNKNPDNKIVIEAAWGWINMAIPVISSTFASFSRMCRNLGVNTLGHLFIDEAGQAVPQAAVGAIFRSRHVMVVGDPSQIKPVLTLDSSVLGMLCNKFGVTEKYLSDSASAQTLVDAASGYGFYRKPDRSDDTWIGIPLWVHRRCQYPMFTISNTISYNGLMVQGKPGNGKTGWFNIAGKANDKYVEAQGEFLLQKIRKMAKENPDILDKGKQDIVYVISPFSNVASCLAEKLDEIKFTRYENGKPTNVGTIHTFQGKEAPVVFLVLGADTQSEGAAKWAVSEPNMMNVAATRAKEEFYIIGDKDMYLKLGGNVVRDTHKVLMQYQKEHPDLVADTIGACPRCQKPILKHNNNNFDCSGNCGMMIGTLFGCALTEEQICMLLDGKEVPYTNKKGDSCIAQPTVVEEEYKGKTQYRWNSRFSTPSIKKSLPTTNGWND